MKNFFIEIQAVKNISSFLRLPPVLTEVSSSSKFIFLGFRIVLGLAISLEASYVTSCLDCRSNIRKKLLYDPVIMAVSLPFQQHSNLSKIQSFSYNEHSFDRKYS